jgi:hypothetical protein
VGTDQAVPCVGGWVIKSQGQKKKIYFFTDYFLLFFIGIGEPLR